MNIMSQIAEYKWQRCLCKRFKLKTVLYEDGTSTVINTCKKCFNISRISENYVIVDIDGSLPIKTRTR